MIAPIQNDENLIKEKKRELEQKIKNNINLYQGVSNEESPSEFLNNSTNNKSRNISAFFVDYMY